MRDEVPETLFLYSDNNALVGVIADGNRSSDRSNVRIIFDSPEPPEEIPKSNSPFSPNAVFALFESIVESGTPGNLPEFSNTEPS